MSSIPFVPIPLTCYYGQARLYDRFHHIKRQAYTSINERVKLEKYLIAYLIRNPKNASFHEDSEMENNPPLKKIEVTSNQFEVNWRYGERSSNIILENPTLNVKLKRCLVTSAKGEFLYEALSISESKNNAIVLVRNQENKIGLVWEWRPIPEKWFWACPRGFADPDDDDSLATAKREMIEEIGNCKIVGSKKIGNLYTNTTFFETPIGLVLLDVEEVETQTSQEEGIVDFKFYTKEEILKMIREDKVEDSITLSAIMRYLALDSL